MNWHKTSEKLPPFGERVIGWFECNKCSPDEYMCVKKGISFPHHGAHFCSWLPPQVSEEQQKEDFWASWKDKEENCSLFKPHWDTYLSHGTPIYWARLKLPIKNNKESRSLRTNSQMDTEDSQTALNK